MYYFCRNEALAASADFTDAIRQMIIREIKRNKDHTSVKGKYSSIVEFYEALQENPNDLKFKRKDGTESILEAKLIKSSSKTHHLALFDKTLVNGLLDTDVFSDATFSICPAVGGVKQIFVVMGKKCNIVSTIVKNYCL